MTQRLVLGKLRAIAPAVRAKRREVAQSRLDYDRRRRMNQRTVETELYMDLLRPDPCAWCGSPNVRVADVDHIVALLRGGPDDWTNMTASCARCNRGRKAEPMLRTLVRLRD